MAKIEVEGLEDILEGLEKITDEHKLRTVIGRVCSVVERSARQKAPKENGELRRSIASKVEVIGSHVVGTVFTPLEYAPYVEFGTGLYAEGGKGRKEVPWVYIEGSTRASKKKTVYASREDAEESAAYLREKKGLNAVVTYGLKPHPYMRPALYENREHIKRLIKEALLNDRLS
jgi:HK97 gp10 family phage protein